MTKKFKLAIALILLSFIMVSCTNTVEANSPITTEQGNGGEEVANGIKPSEPVISEEEKAKIELEKKIEVRNALEKKNKEEQGEFYVPLVKIEEKREKKTTEVKALYATGYTAGNELNKENIDAYGAYVKALAEKDAKKANELFPQADKANRFERIVGLAVGTEINGVVINVKDDNGFITYNTEIDIVKEMNKDTPIPINDIKNMLKVLKEYDLYTIGRIVTFKDKHLAVAKPEHAIQLKSGGTWLDPNSGNIPWINPFDKYVWDYNIAIAKEAALLGFDEIQFDYVRFPDGSKKYNEIAEFPGREGRDKDEAIRDFLKCAKEELKPYNVNIGADVFGLITRTWDDYPEDIGQTWILIGEYADVVCPMVYPSHYSTGWYDLTDPNAKPYELVKGAMEEALEKNSSLEKPPIIRSWLQDFNWKGKEYGPKEIRSQIIAAKELGLTEFLIWNPSNVYDPNSYILSDVEKDTVYPLDKGELDHRDKLPSDAADKYLNGKINGRFSYMYLMTPIADREKDFDKYKEKEEKSTVKILNYKIHGYEMDSKDKNLAIVDLYYKYEKTTGASTEVIEKDNVKWTAIREKGIWKIKSNFN